MANRCKALNASGGPCSAPPLADEVWCIWHHPERQAERAEVQRRGGIARSNVLRARKQLAPALTPGELNQVLSGLMTDLVAGIVDPGVVTAAANLARAYVAVQQVGTIETVQAKVAEMELLMGGKSA